MFKPSERWLDTLQSLSVTSTRPLAPSAVSPFSFRTRPRRSTIAPLGRAGVRETFQPELSPEEEKLLTRSADTLKKAAARAGASAG